MPRVNKMQHSGEDLLDQILFHELVVRTSMTDLELEQLADVIRRVDKMVGEKFSGTEAEIVTHLSYCFLDICLADPIIKFRESGIAAEFVPKLGLSDEESLKAEKSIALMHVAVLLAITETVFGIDASFAVEVRDALVDKFAAYSPLVRGNLAQRCFAFECPFSSALTYCWLVNKGVFQSKKHVSSEIFSDFHPDFSIRLHLLAVHEALKNSTVLGISTLQSQIASLSVLRSNREKFEIKEFDKLTDVKYGLEKAEGNKSVLLGLTIDQLTSPDHSAIQQFFTMLAAYSHRYRMNSGTLASWPGLIATAHMWTLRESYINPSNVFNAYNPQYILTRLSRIASVLIRSAVRPALPSFAPSGSLPVT